MILLAVLVVVVMAALAGTTAMYYGEAAAAGSEISLKRTRSRALAWSGVQAVMAELDAQRDRLLDGESPLVTTQWQLFESGAKRGIVRLIALEKDEAGLERWAVSENAKLDLNKATAEMLAQLGPLDQVLCDSIVSARQGGFASVEELVRIPGVGAILNEEASAGESTIAAEPSIDSLLTVLSFDPNIQAGVDASSADSKGKLRVNLNTPWSDELAAAIQQRFGADAVSSAKALFDAGEKFKTMSDLVRVLRRTGMPASAWPAVLDVFTISPDPFIAGRVDINKAPARVLAAIPGFSPEAAEEVVHRRQGLDSSAKRSIVWPVIEGILTEEEFVPAADWMTTRSLQWRVRIEVGVINADDQAAATEQAKLDERMAVEAVIDVASERPRVAYMRDVTLEGAATLLTDYLESEADAALANGDRAETDEPIAASPEAGLNMDATLKLNATLDFGGAESTPSPVEPAKPEVTAAPPSQPAEPVDRRIGRWTSRTGASGQESKP